MKTLTSAPSIWRSSGTICRELDPPPITATFLLRKLYLYVRLSKAAWARGRAGMFYLSFHCAECIFSPLKSSQPGMSGHFMSLRNPRAAIKTSTSSSSFSPLSRRSMQICLNHVTLLYHGSKCLCRTKREDSPFLLAVIPSTMRDFVAQVDESVCAVFLRHAFNIMPDLFSLCIESTPSLVWFKGELIRVCLSICNSVSSVGR